MNHNKTTDGSLATHLIPRVVEVTENFTKIEDVDLALIFGIGFPPFRGGLLKYADTEGLDRILKALNGYESSISEDRYKASPYLSQLVSEKKKFYDLG